MTRRQAATILTAFVLLYLATLVVLAPRLDLIDIPDQVAWWAAAVCGLVLASPAFLAIWAVHGRQRAAVRLPSAGWLLVAFFMASLYGEVRYFGHGDADLALMFTFAWFTASTALVLALWLLRAVRGWRLEWIETAPVVGSGRAILALDRNGIHGQDARATDWEKAQRQFTLRTLLIWTAAVAMLCAGISWLAPYNAFDGDDLSSQLAEYFVFGPLIGLILALASLPAVSVAWLVLADGRRLVLRFVLIAITIAGIPAGIATIRYLLDADEPEFVALAVGIEAGVLAAGLATAGLLRICGYRLVRPCPLPEFTGKMPVPLPETTGRMPVPRSRYSLACATLAVVWLALACCVPARFELWRRADLQQAWVDKGWEPEFDDAGRITSMTVLGRELPETELDTAGLDHLQSLSCAHLVLNDVPIYTPELAHRLTSLNLSDTLIDDNGLQSLLRFPNVTGLNLSQTQITDAGIARLAGLPLKEHLTRLELTATDLSDEAVESLTQLERLESLDLQLTGVSEEGVRRLREALPRTTIMHGADDRSLKGALMTTVRTVNGRSIVIARIAKRPTRLHARGRLCVCGAAQAISPPLSPTMGVTDAGVATLVALPELEDLDLRDSAVTDAGLPSLAKLPKLRRIDLRGTQVTEDGCRKLSATLTNCEILR